MQRYFIESNQFVEQTVIIMGEDAHHITKVMRMKEGDTFKAVLPDGTVSTCVIQTLDDQKVVANASEWLYEKKELPIQVTISSGLPKGDKLEFIFQKGTELGATEFIPFNAARSVVKWDMQKVDKKLGRWKKIAKEAAEQSHRTKIPTIHAPLALRDLLIESQRFSHKLIAYEEEAKTGEQSKFAKTITQMQSGDSLLVVFGPEGGLSEDEVKSFQSAGFISVGLGPRILRTETAPLYVLSALSYHFELMR